MSVVVPGACHIRFQGREWILIGDAVSGGPICTPERFRNFEVAYAVLNRAGKVMRFKEQIGTRDDIEFGEGPVVLDITTAGLINMLDVVGRVLDGEPPWTADDEPEDGRR